MFTSISSTAVNLLRGITDYSRLSKNEAIDTQSFMRQLNHPGPGITSLQRFFPAQNYDIEQFHSSEVMFHLKVLRNCEESIKLSYGSCTRYPVTLGIDEQEINPGTHLNDGCLHGLANSLTVEDVKKIGLDNLHHHIAQYNNFITAVREYRLTDFKSCMCSNVYTSFESGCMDTDTCTAALKKVAKLANSCWFCLSSGKECNYIRFNEKCTACEANGEHCVSLVVMLVLWDMGSAHKSTAKKIEKIEITSTDTEFMLTDLFCVSFGGLHLCKCVINTSRCYAITHNGENFGIYILRALKNGNDRSAVLLSQIKNAVFVGKDRQSDYLSYMTCCPLVQNALKEKDVYSLIRVPEKILHYTENAKTQKDIISPLSVQCNNNGDTFVLDQGASCVHIFDRSDVARGYIIGKYKCPNTSDYPAGTQVLAKDVFFSSSLKHMAVKEDNVYIADDIRKEVIILRKCSLAQRALTSRVFLLKIDNCVGILCLHNILLVLCKNMEDSSLVIEGLDFTIPTGRADTFVLSTEVKFSFAPDYEIQGMFMIQLGGFSFGARSNNDNLFFYTITGADSQCQETMTSVKSSITPCSHEGGIVVYNDLEGLETLHVSTDAQGNLVFTQSSKMQLKSKPVVINQWGKVVNVIGVLNEEGHVLEEVGQLNFAAKFCNGVMRFYNAITYVPPHGDQSCRQMSIMESIANGEFLVDLLLSMQSSLEKKFPSRKAFTRANGTPCSDTIECVRMTVDGWKALAERLNFLSPGLHNSLYPQTVTNEGMVEHSFGFVMKKGQGHMQTMYEYASSKRKHALDFQLRMCDTPFNQYEKIKLRDKGYQQLNPALKSKLNLSDLREIFSSKADKEQEKRQLSPEDEKLLQAAFLLTKSVPRQTNRCKWRQASGYTPNLLKEKDSGKVKQGDLLFFESYNGIVYLKVVKDTLLVSKNQCIDVTSFDGNQVVQTISADKLMMDKGQVLVLPSYLYTVENGKVFFADVAQEIFWNILDQKHEGELTDQEWSLLFSCNGDVDVEVDFQAECSSSNQRSEASSRLYGKTCNVKKRKEIGKARSSNKQRKKQKCNVDEWVTVVNGNDWYPGVVTAVHEDETITVNCMENTLVGKNIFKWPSIKMETVFRNEDVLCTVTAPNPVNSRGGYSLSSVDFKKLSGLLQQR